MKTRDVIKYAFASILALVTLAAIAGMTYAKHQRQRRDPTEAQRIERTLNTFGQQGRIPEKLPQPKDQPALGGNT
ncbi:MAG: hypothetical protein ACR2IE_01050 [Candidatus Sumerlaeaceae bacterium]